MCVGVLNWGKCGERQEEERKGVGKGKNALQQASLAARSGGDASWR